MSTHLTKSRFELGLECPNQLFRISKKGDGRTGILKKVQSIEETGTPVLSRKEVSDIASMIKTDEHKYHDNLSFQELLLFPLTCR